LTRKQRSYYAFLKAAKRGGLKHGEALSLRKKIQEKTGNDFVPARYISDHPSITKRLTREIRQAGPSGRATARVKPSRAVGRDSGSRGGRDVGGSGASGTGSHGGNRSAGASVAAAAPVTVDQWDAMYDDFDSYDYEEYDSSADYGETTN
jgi:hypothetical protein